MNKSEIIKMTNHLIRFCNSQSDISEDDWQELNNKIQDKIETDYSSQNIPTWNEITMYCEILQDICVND